MGSSEVDQALRSAQCFDLVTQILCPVYSWAEPRLSEGLGVSV